VKQFFYHKIIYFLITIQHQKIITDGLLRRLVTAPPLFFFKGGGGYRHCKQDDDCVKQLLLHFNAEFYLKGQSHKKEIMIWDGSFGLN
jgi:hypothetical protein